MEICNNAPKTNVDYAKNTSRWNKVSKKRQKNVKTKTHYNLSILFGLHKRGEVEIRHIPSCYEQINFLLWHKPSLYFYETHIQLISDPTKTIRLNEYNVLFPRDKYGKVDVKNGICDMNNQQKKQHLSMRGKEAYVFAYQRLKVWTGK